MTWIACIAIFLVVKVETVKLLPAHYQRQYNSPKYLSSLFHPSLLNSDGRWNRPSSILIFNIFSPPLAACHLRSFRIRQKIKPTNLVSVVFAYGLLFIVLYCLILSVPHSSLDFRHLWCSVEFGKGIQNSLLSEKAPSYLSWHKQMAFTWSPSNVSTTSWCQLKSTEEYSLTNASLDQMENCLKLHDWSHFQNIAKGTTDPRVEFCLSK